MRYSSVEVDWSRHNSHFVPGTEYDHRHIGDPEMRVVKNAVNRIELVVGIEQVQPEDRILVSINGHDLTGQWDHVVAPHIALARERERSTAGLGDARGD